MNACLYVCRYIVTSIYRDLQLTFEKPFFKSSLFSSIKPLIFLLTIKSHDLIILFNTNGYYALWYSRRFQLSPLCPLPDYKLLERSGLFASFCTYPHSDKQNALYTVDILLVLLKGTTEIYCVYLAKARLISKLISKFVNIGCVRQSSGRS